MAKLELARALGYHRDYTNSTQLYQELLASNPDNEPATLGLIRNLMHQKRTAEARRELNRALVRHPDSTRLQEYKNRMDKRGRPSATEERAAAGGGETTRPTPWHWRLLFGFRRESFLAIYPSV